MIDRDGASEHFMPLLVWLAISFALMATAFGPALLPTNDFVDENNTTGEQETAESEDPSFLEALADAFGLGGVVSATVTVVEGIQAFLDTLFAFLTFDIPCSDEGTKLTKCPPGWVRWAFGAIVGGGMGFSIFSLIRG